MASRGAGRAPSTLFCSAHNLRGSGTRSPSLRFGETFAKRKTATPNHPDARSSSPLSLSSFLVLSLRKKTSSLRGNIREAEDRYPKSPSRSLIFASVVVLLLVLSLRKKSAAGKIGKHQTAIPSHPAARSSRFRPFELAMDKVKRKAVFVPSLRKNIFASGKYSRSGRPLPQVTQPLAHLRLCRCPPCLCSRFEKISASGKNREAEDRYPKSPTRSLNALQSGLAILPSVFAVIAQPFTVNRGHRFA